MQDKAIMSKLVQEINKMDTEKMINKIKSTTRSVPASNKTTNGKNSHVGSRGPSLPRTRQGTPVNVPSTPSAADYTHRSK